MNTANNKNYMSIGVSVRTTKFAARNNSIGVRQESNPQSPTAYSSVRYGQPYQPGKLRFNNLTTNVFHAVGQFFAEDFSSFDKLVFKRKKQKARQTFSLGLIDWFFISAEKKARRTIWIGASLLF